MAHFSHLIELDLDQEGEILLKQRVMTASYDHADLGKVSSIAPAACSGLN